MWHVNQMASTLTAAISA